LTLALGSAATTVMFTVINGVLLKPLAYPEADRLVTLHGKTESMVSSGASPTLSFRTIKAPAALWDP
jgi:hypothetical protein